MIRNLLAAGALSALVAVPATAQAFDIEAMTPAEEEAFGEAVREYLMNNPELLREWITLLQDSEALAEASADSELVAENREAIFEDDHSWVGGNPEGDVTMVEFLDYRCSYCRRAHPEVKELVASDGNIRKIIKEFPILGDESVLASRFAIATRLVAGDDAYAAMSDALMTHRGNFTEDALSRMADEAGLDGAAIVARMEAPEVTEAIQKNYDLAKAMNIGGTPTFVIGETMLRGYVPLDGMRAVVDDTRAE